MNIDSKTRKEYTKIASYYYELGMTQEEIANRISLSRQKVNRVIKQCIELGIVKILKWYKENFPEKYDKVKCCISCKDWLRYKLTSEFNCEITDASTSYIDLHTKEYPKELFEKLGIVST